MKTAFFSTKAYDRRFFEVENTQFQHELTYFEPRLTQATCGLADGFPAVCAFVNDQLTEDTLRHLHGNGLQVIALRCAGFNNVDLTVAAELGIAVVRVPAYSPYAVAEHTLALILALNRHLCRAWTRVRDGDFRLEGLLGFDLHNRTAGVVGTGRIGECVCRILRGCGCRVLAFDVRENPECLALGVEYADQDDLLRQSDIVTLHCPLTPETHHLINDDAIGSMKEQVMLINTSRGGIIDTRAVIRGLKSGRIGSLGIDVYEEEADLFFEDLSGQVIRDDTFARLLTFPNVLITGHQAFFTEDALRQIAHTTLQNLSELEAGDDCANRVTADRLAP